MDSWVVPLIVGVATSLATVTVGFLTYRQSRRDIRENLKRDIELHAAMPADWTGRTVLQWYIEQRIRELPVSEPTARRMKTLLAITALGPVFGLGLAYRHLNDGTFEFAWRYLAGNAALIVIILLMLNLQRTTRNLHRLHVRRAFNVWRAAQSRGNSNSSQ